jgi:hypothetical protein
MKLEPTSSHHYQIYEALYSDTGCEKMGKNNKMAGRDRKFTTTALRRGVQTAPARLRDTDR